MGFLGSGEWEIEFFYINFFYVEFFSATVINTYVLFLKRPVQK